MTASVPTKPKPPRRLGGWELYDYELNKQSKTATLAYKHDSGAWAILRPFKSGIPLMVFAAGGRLGVNAEQDLRKLLKYAMKGTRGVDVDIGDATRAGGTEEAYIEYGL